MKADFSQNFEMKNIHVELLVRYSRTKKFMLYRSNKSYEADWHNVPSLDIDSYSRLSQTLARHLYAKGLILENYRELARQTKISFSLVDDTPGSDSQELCLLVEVDGKINDINMNDSELRAVFVPLDEILEHLSTGPYISPVVVLGVAKLLSEAKELKGFEL